MVSSLVFCSADIGRNFRLLRMARRLASKKESKVIVIGSELSSLPKKIEKLPNVSFRPLARFVEVPLLIAPLLFPFKLFLRILEFIVIKVTIGHVDQVICSTNPLFVEPLIGWILAKSLRATLIFDVSPFRYTRKSRFYVEHLIMMLERQITAIADSRFVPTKAMQVVLSLHCIDSSVLRDLPGEMFKYNHGNREEIIEIMNIPINSLIIGLVLPNFSHAELTAVTEIVRTAESPTPLCLLVFGGNKLEKSIESHLSDTNNVTMRFVSINSTLYAIALGACDAAILFHGSRYGLDISPQLTEVVSSGTPAIVQFGGCVSEIISDGVNGFIFRDFDDFAAVFTKILREGGEELRKMKEALVVQDFESAWSKFL